MINKTNKPKMTQDKLMSQYTNAIISTLREPFLILDSSLKVVFANNSFYTLFKVNKKETIGKIVTELGNSQFKIPKLIDLIKKVLPNKIIVTDFEIKHKFEKIGLRVVSINARKLILSEPDNKILKKNLKDEFVLMAIEDVTDQKKKYDAILASIGDAVLACDTNGLITLFNRSAEILTGFSASEAIGVHYNELMKLVRERDEKPSNDFISWAMKNRQKTKMANHTLLIRKDGFKVPVADSAAPIIDVNDELLGCVVVFRDTTQERDIDRAKSDFVSLASHQLKAPPTTIEWLIETLLEEKNSSLTARQREYLLDVHNKTEQMINTVNTLLDVSRIELGKYAVVRTPVDLKLSIRSILEELKSLIVTKKVKLEEKITSKKIVIPADANLLRMVAQNLITNAINYTPESGTVTVRVLVKGKGDKIGGRTISKNSAVIVVSDTGCGIPKHQQDKIFTKLFRADNARLKQPEGTGLGLYIVKSVLNTLGGSIWFKSEENKGSDFYVTIPILSKKSK